MAHAVVRLDRVKSIYNGNVLSAVHTADMDNGMFVQLDGLVAGERDLYQVKVPDATSIGEKKAFLVAAPEINYDESRRSSGALANFFNEAGKATRVYEVAEVDEFSVTAEAIDAIGAEPVVGNFVVQQAGSLKGKEVATPAGTERFVGKIVAKEVLGTTTVVGAAGAIGRPLVFYTIEVVKN